MNTSTSPYLSFVRLAQRIWPGTATRQAPVVPELLDNLDDAELRLFDEGLGDQFNAKLTSAAYRRIAGSAGDEMRKTVTLRGSSTASKKTGRIVYSDAHHSVKHHGNTIQIIYTSRKHEMTLEFECAANTRQSLERELIGSVTSICTAFLGLFYRYLERDLSKDDSVEERRILESVHRTLFLENNPQKCLASVCEETGHIFAVCHTYNPVTQQLIEVCRSSSDFPLSRTRPFLQCSELSGWKSLVAGDSNVVSISLTSHYPGNCNCEELQKAGCGTATLIGVGAATSSKNPAPRAVVTLYSTASHDEAMTDRNRLLLVAASREIAGWINAVDEKQERVTIDAITKATGQICDMAVNSSRANIIMPVILKTISGYLSNKYGMFEENAPGPTKLSLIVGQESYLEAGQDHPFPPLRDLPEMCCEGARFRHRVSDDGNVQLEVLGQASDSIMLQILSPASHLGLFRPYLWHWLAIIVRVAYRLVQLEERRSRWIQRTIHEIRHPLQGMVAVASEVHRMTSSPDFSRRDLRHFMEDLETSSLRLASLLHVFENVAGLESLPPRVTDVLIERDVMRPVRRLLESHARRRRITIRSDRGFFLIPSLKCDPELLSVVVYNVVDNAIKYSPKGGVVAIEFGTDDKSRYVMVSNEGPEILISETEDIFDFDVRGSNAAAVATGLGIGLPIARRIMRRLGGDVKLKSSGQGSERVVFCIYLP